ncbi:HI1506-related protein [Tianweitania sediminis]|uniref:Mu-like prophage FluMu N-terminal domain-containing protein n=1 Tax=Tianweitania sediminis TaxID=1502156 RepID=A0A8J7UK87_9HYPH|nr:HI1506-related protein [Tianweitania sediminis]MBP0439439.1 hypothetical protein [Tianweitania sediminis]
MVKATRTTKAKSTTPAPAQAVEAAQPIAIEIANPAGETIRSTQGGAMEPALVTGQSPVGAGSPHPNPEAKTSEDNGRTSAAEGAPMAGEASRPDAGRSASATSEIMDATAGETAPIQPEQATEQRENVPSQDEVRPGSTSLGIEQQSDTLGVTAGREPAFHPSWAEFDGLDLATRELRFPNLWRALEGWADNAPFSELAFGPHVRIQARIAGFRRAGMAHGLAPAEYPGATFTPDQLEALLVEPNLVVELVTAATTGADQA